MYGTINGKVIQCLKNIFKFHCTCRHLVKTVNDVLKLLIQWLILVYKVIFLILIIYQTKNSTWLIAIFRKVHFHMKKVLSCVAFLRNGSNNFDWHQGLWIFCTENSIWQVQENLFSPGKMFLQKHSLQKHDSNKFD